MALLTTIALTIGGAFVSFQPRAADKKTLHPTLKTAMIAAVDHTEGGLCAIGQDRALGDQFLTEPREEGF